MVGISGGCQGGVDFDFDVTAMNGQMLYGASKVKRCVLRLSGCQADMQ